MGGGGRGGGGGGGGGGRGGESKSTDACRQFYQAKWLQTDPSVFGPSEIWHYKYRYTFGWFPGSGIELGLQVLCKHSGQNGNQSNADLRWAKSCDSYCRMASESYRRDSNHWHSLAFISPPTTVNTESGPHLRAAIGEFAHLRYRYPLFSNNGE